jgi:predicted metal-binding membrane protein
MAVNGAESALLFLAMWGVMMVAMMLPPLVPVLIDYRRRSGVLPIARLDQLTCWFPWAISLFGLRSACSFTLERCWRM